MQQLPCNFDAERGLVGSIMLDNRLVDDVSLIVSPADFLSDVARVIYSEIADMVSAGCNSFDAVTIAERLERRKKLSEVGGVDAIIDIVDSCPHAGHAIHYAEIVRDKALLRRLIRAGSDVVSLAYSSDGDATEQLAHAETAILAVRGETSAGQVRRIVDVARETCSRIEERIRNRGSPTGRCTGFAELDMTLSGLGAGQLIILAARPAMGKTAFVLNVANHIAGNGLTAVLFSLEMSATDLAERLIAIRGRIDYSKLRNGQLEEYEYQAVKTEIDGMQSSAMVVNEDASIRVSDIAAVCRRVQRRNPIGVVIVDYLQLITPEDRRVPREQQIAAITRRLKALAKDLQVPVVALAQLNRAVETREDKRPKLSDLRESGAIEQDADVVLFLHRPDVYDPEDSPGVAEVIVSKHRSGPTGTVKLEFQKSLMTFRELQFDSSGTDFNAFDFPAGWGDRKDLL